MLHVEIGTCLQLTQAVHEKLRNIDIFNATQFLSQDLEDLAAKSAVSFRDLLCIRRYLLAKHASSLVSGLQLYHSLIESAAILPTGCDELNCLLDGGIYTGEIVELSGEGASGKTQICLCMTVAVASETEKDVVYFDIGGAFSASRLCQILNYQNITSECKVETILKRIQIVRITDVFQMMTELHKLRLSLSNTDSHAVKLVVIDCFSWLFVNLGYEDCCMYSTRITFTLKSMAVDFSFSVLVSKLVNPNSANHWSPAVRPNASLEVKKASPALGDNMSETRAVISVTGSCRLPSSRSIEICISDKGICASNSACD